MNEFKLIEAFTRKIPRNLQGDIPIGDDAAAQLSPRGVNLLFTADAVVDGVDFHVKKIEPEDAGHKALAVNLSDIAAMGGTPSSCLITLGIPKGFSEKWLIRFYSGLTALAKRFHVKILGGDITKAGQFFASIALIGHAKPKEVIRRSGAKPGDFLYVSGKLGGSILGHHFDFEPRVKEGRFLASRFLASSLIDISDGFWQDLEHVLKASKAGARIDLEKVPVSAFAKKLAKGNPCKALEHALTDGEDFELLFTVREAKSGTLEREWKRVFPKVLLTQVGRIQKKSGIEWYYEGERTQMKKGKKGYRHF